MRDAPRTSFPRSVVVGPLGDCHARSWRSAPAQVASATGIPHRAAARRPKIAYCELLTSAHISPVNSLRTNGAPPNAGMPPG